ncbi:hypothetical protein LJR039_005027 [Pseudorhodoferax sp. LjRoot39]|uniref:hypothetical protein n=1 Tax=Pseudorhodoferax sp. LjRoot39 TaxID=3342328 RepID=UPI003ED08B09
MIAIPANHTTSINIAKLVYDNTISAHQHHIEMLGLELEHASGVRALAADFLIRKYGEDHFDEDRLFSYCDALVGNDRLFESHDDEANRIPTDFVLDVGCPFGSLGSYLALRELLGDNWLLLATIEYAARWGSADLRSDPAEKAALLVERARAAFQQARHAKFERWHDLGRFTGFDEEMAGVDVNA